VVPQTDINKPSPMNRWAWLYDATCTDRDRERWR